MTLDKGTDIIYTSCEKTGGVIDRVPETERRRGVLVFIKKKECAHSNAPGLALLVHVGNLLFSASFPTWVFSEED